MHISYSELSMVKDLLESEPWDSLLINRKHPFTYRLFFKFPIAGRVCLHKMLPGDTIPHPHKYNVRVALLSGSYVHKLYYQEGIEEQVLNSGDQYEINDPNQFHSVHVESVSYSVMFNDRLFSQPNPACLSTSNKGLDRLTVEEYKSLKKEFLEILDGFCV